MSAIAHSKIPTALRGTGPNVGKPAEYSFYASLSAPESSGLFNPSFMDSVTKRNAALIQARLEPPKPVYSPGDYFTVEDIDFLSQWAINKLTPLFPATPKSVKGGPRINYTYSFDVNCSSCGCLMVLEGSRSNLFYYIKLKRDQGKDICSSCEKKEQEEREIKRKIDNEKRDKELETWALEYIDKYLDPEKRWPDGTKLRRAFWDIIVRVPKSDLIADHIKTMPYGDFLRTPYWICVAAEVRHRAGYKCQLCSSNGKLNVHHRTYEHHGYETYYYKEDLICLCDLCHLTFHQERSVTASDGVPQT